MHAHPPKMAANVVNNENVTEEKKIIVKFIALMTVLRISFAYRVFGPHICIYNIIITLLNRHYHRISLA